MLSPRRAQGAQISPQSHPNFPELRLIAGLFETYGVPTSPKSSVGNPRIEELTTPKETKRCFLDLSGLTGLLAPGQ